jgi:hypothetical protein
MSKLFAWDECNVDGGIQVYETPQEEGEMRKASQEGGWEYKETLPNGVQVYRTDRHFGVEVRAETRLEALEKFLAFDTFLEFVSDRELRMMKVITEGRVERLKDEIARREHNKAN